MRRNKAKIAGIFLILSTMLALICSQGFAVVNAGSKKTLPTPRIMGLSATYNKGEKISFDLSSIDYIGKVQFKIIMIRVNSKETYNITKGYSGYVASKKNYRINLPILTKEGNYKLTTYVKRSNSSSNYDKYITRNFSVTKDVLLKKSKQTYELPSSNNTLTGNIIISGNDISVRNVNLKGKVIINTSPTGKVYLYNVKSEAIEIKEKGARSVELFNVLSKSVSITNNRNNAMVIELKGSTQLKVVNINSKVNFTILDKASILKFRDIKKMSNLRINTKSKIVITTESGITIINGNTTTTTSAIAPEDPPKVGITPIRVETPVLPPTLPEANGEPVVEYVGMLLSTSNIPQEFLWDNKNYTMDLSSMEDESYIKRLCIIVSKDSSLTIHGQKFDLKAHVLKQIKVLKDFGIEDNLPEGIGTIAARDLFGNSLELNGELRDGVNPVRVIGITIKLK